MPRRRFLGLGTVGVASLATSSLWAQENETGTALTEPMARLEYLTREEHFGNVGRGKPPPHELPLEKRREAGLVPETWQLEVGPDPDSDAKVERPLLKERGTALNWDGLMKLAEKQAVRYLHVMSCTNGHAPLGMGLWEGVPLREVIGMARPTANVRRVFYYGYHNDDPKQRFQSSLTLDRVLEEAPGELPVILCYKFNGQWLTPKRGAPVRMIVPDAYGNKSVKWLQRIVLTNKPQLNDTYAEWNNDTESRLKTCAFFRQTPKTVKAGHPLSIAGTAQVGVSGLSKVQYWLHPQAMPLPKDDPYFTQADWRDARILPPPTRWGGGLPDGKLPSLPLQFDVATGQPRQWPLRNSMAHWAATLVDLRPGQYDLRCRTIDANGIAQPLPRPLLKSGYNAIQKVALTVEA